MNFTKKNRISFSIFILFQLLILALWLSKIYILFELTKMLLNIFVNDNNTVV